LKICFYSANVLVYPLAHSVHHPAADHYRSAITGGMDVLDKALEITDKAAVKK
jgi:hypothetical protein